jgi:hypothetical protein
MLEMHAGSVAIQFETSLQFSLNKNQNVAALLVYVVCLFTHHVHKNQRD